VDAVGVIEDRYHIHLSDSVVRSTDDESMHIWTTTWSVPKVPRHNPSIAIPLCVGAVIVVVVQVVAIVRVVVAMQGERRRQR